MSSPAALSEQLLRLLARHRAESAPAPSRPAAITAWVACWSEVEACLAKKTTAEPLGHFSTGRMRLYDGKPWQGLEELHHPKHRRRHRRLRRARMQILMEVTCSAYAGGFLAWLLVMQYAINYCSSRKVARDPLRAMGFESCVRLARSRGPSCSRRKSKALASTWRKTVFRMLRSEFAVSYKAFAGVMLT